VPTKILVVDDDPVLCEFIQEVLISEKMEAHVLTDSRQAAARLKVERFDAVFLDMRMPSPNGIELASHIRSAGPNKTTPIVMITGEEDRTLMVRAFQVGVNLFLHKPVDRTRLMRLLRAADNFIQHEKRRFVRVKVGTLVSLESGEHRFTGTTLDVSLGGFLVQTSHTPPVGSTVRVSLELQSGKPPLRLTARVVRVSKDDCMGVQFENLGTNESSRLQEFLLPLILTAN
jgi:DNA-binding response OmpR family regulator